MRYSRLLIPTLKEAPAEAQVVSHVLLIRAGFIRKIAAGVYTLLPLGLRVVHKIQRILREELAVESEILAIDGIELRDFDYIDLGRIRLPSCTVPVTIKSLVFSEDPRCGRPPQRIHHHDHGDGHDERDCEGLHRPQGAVDDDG